MVEAHLLQLVGLAPPPLVTVAEGIQLHTEALPHWQHLQARAAQAGVSLRAVSAYRDFNRQLAIWNGKACGERMVLDAASRPLDIRCLNDDDKLRALLVWSAVPGCSRHHWGSDVDVAAALPAGYSLQLVPEEYAENGVLAALGQWLAGNDLAACGFARPFLPGRSRVAFEPWHLSCVSVAAACEAQLSPVRLLEVLMAQPIALKDAIARHWPTIYRHYIAAPCLTPLLGMRS